MAKSVLDFLVRQTQNRKYLGLQFGIMNPDAATAYLVAIEDNVVGGAGN